MFEKIAKWYRHGLWSALQVEMAATKKLITAEEAARILQR